ncbi:MAG: SH3 domain-containing protein [Oscillospiraceae bacterium]|nr:SH3 domain-containing protein [Oscillospiraceae bacterium]MDD4414131.1 SH3 domain-containing protein [Oscillospiraceae bacterium]
MKTKDYKPTRIFASGFSLVFRLVCITVVLALSAVMFGCKKPDDTSSATSTTISTAPETQPTIQDVTIPSETETTTGTIPEGTPSVGWCNADSLRVRSGPGTEYNGIGGLKHGEKVTIVGREGDWYKIEFKDDFAFVSAQFIQSTEIIPTQTEIDETTTTAAQ